MIINAEYLRIQKEAMVTYRKQISRNLIYKIEGNHETLSVSVRNTAGIRTATLPNTSLMRDHCHGSDRYGRTSL
jgi:hypothetical protein